MTTNNKQQTTNNKQQTTNNKQQTTNNKQQTTLAKCAFCIFLLVAYMQSGLQAANCGSATINQNVTPPNAQVQFVTLPPQFTNMQVDCNTNTNALCATSLNVTDSTVVLDTTIPGQYTNLNDYNFLRSNKSIFPTFDNEFVITPTFATTFFGIVTAISGDGSMLAIGCTDSIATDPAFVDIYRRTGNSWIFAQHINRPIASINGFGGSVALSYDGSVLAVGSPDDNTTFGASTGIACIALYDYNTTNNSYNLTQIIEGSVFSAFGATIALSATGQYLAISEGSALEASGFYTPAVYVYTRSHTCGATCTASNTWELQQYLTCTDNNGAVVHSRNQGSEFSSQRIGISADGTTIAFGTPFRIDPAALPRGAVTIFKRTGASWNQTQLITSQNAVNSDRFGTSVALSGNGKYLAAKQQIDALGSSGRCYVFEQHGLTYVLNFNFASASLLNSTGGVALSHDGTTLAIGIATNPNTGSGAAGIFIALRGPNNQWSVPYSILRNINTVMGFAVACSADGAFIVAGSPGLVGGSGSASVFRPVGSFIPNDTVITGSLCVYNRTTIDAALKVAGNVHLNGTIVTGTAGHVTACTAILSDNRMKDNVAPLSAEEALAKLKALTPVSFEFISSSSSSAASAASAGPSSVAAPAAMAGSTRRECGFVAQHVEQVFPQFVGSRPATDGEGPLIHDGNTKTILIRAELYAYLIASLEKLVERNTQRKKELAKLPYVLEN